MTWNLTAWGRSRLPLTGVPWRELTDEEFAAAEILYPEIQERGYFERVTEVTVEGPSVRPRRGAPPPDPESEFGALSEHEEDAGG